mmetsp:Transcript_19696/g.58127  ORF Transcript_19696/g.58127 Transcript_19696/m.58127 type:complete len:274 (+) Transcript_19696:285-1106(+)
MVERGFVVGVLIRRIGALLPDGLVEVHAHGRRVHVLLRSGARPREVNAQDDEGPAHGRQPLEKVVGGCAVHVRGGEELALGVTPEVWVVAARHGVGEFRVALQGQHDAHGPDQVKGEGAGGAEEAPEDAPEEQRDDDDGRGGPEEGRFRLGPTLGLGELGAVHAHNRARRATTSGDLGHCGAAARPPAVDVRRELRGRERVHAEGEEAVGEDEGREEAHGELREARVVRGGMRVPPQQAPLVNPVEPQGVHYTVHVEQRHPGCVDEHHGGVGQ